jgi:hypothetical protein
MNARDAYTLAYWWHRLSDNKHVDRGMYMDIARIFIRRDLSLYWILARQSLVAKQKDQNA